MTLADRWIWRFLFAAFALLVLPVLVAEIPPLLDYPNHLVRMWLIAAGARTPPLSEIYEVTWASARTNVGIDYAAALLGQIIPATSLGSLFVFLAVILPPLGALLLNRALFGGWHWWQIAFAFFAWNATLIAGFLNFQIGLGLALCAAALEPRLAPMPLWQRTAARFAMGALLMTVHAFALAFYALLVAALAFGRDLGDVITTRGISRRIGAAAMAGFGAALAILPFLLLTATLPGAHVDSAGNAPFWDYSIFNKLRVADLAHLDLCALARPAAGARHIRARDARAPPTPPLRPRRTGARRCRPLISPACRPVGRRRHLVDRQPLPADGRAHADRRVAPEPRPRCPRTFHGRGRLAGRGYCAHRNGGRRLGQRQTDIASVRRAVETVPAGATILPLDHGREQVEPSAYPFGRYFHRRHPVHWYYPVLPIMWRQAFVPILFWAAGKQPIRVRPPWDEIAPPEIGLSPSITLIEPDANSAYFLKWRERFDYVLLVNADVGSGIDLAKVPELELLRDEGFARLYRIRRPPPAR